MPHECHRDGLPSFGLSACYGCLKDKALNGGFDKLTDEERVFVGVEHALRRERARQDGWVPGSSFEDILAKAYDELGIAPPQSRLGFLGG